MCGAPEQTLDRSGIPAGETVVQGVVLRGGQPAAGNYVRLLDSGGDFTAEVVTSATGLFRFFTRPGDWTVRVLGPGQGTDQAVTASKGDVTEVTIRID